MTNSAGSFVWYELMSPDPDASKAFYDAVVGWAIEPRPAGEMDYRMIGRSDGGNAGGVLGLTEAMIAEGAKATWLGYLSAPDVDARAAAIVSDGGIEIMPPHDMPGVGRFALVADPQGAQFYLMDPAPPSGQEDASSDVFSVDQAQHVRWNELQSSDPVASTAFYTGHFGWTQQGEMEMGAFGIYRFVQIAGTGVGAIMPKLPASPQSAWTFFFGVDDIDRAAGAVTAGGGTLDGPISPIPGGEFSVHCADPHGARFGLVGPRK